MASGLISIRRRIKSVAATRKITKAMELVATAKLKKNKDRFLLTATYTSELASMTANVLTRAKDHEHLYLSKVEGKGTLYIVVTSNLGLCGAYNANVIKEVLPKIQSGDKLIVVGMKGYNVFKRKEINIIQSLLTEVTSQEQLQANEIAKFALTEFKNKNVSKISLVYTRYVNSVTFQPTTIDLLPVDPKQFEVKVGKGKEFLDTLFEPNIDSVLDVIVPLYFESVIFGKLVEAHTSEQAARRLAMENATDNADEIKDKLLIVYNKERQSAITQEMSEIVAGANAI
jgi:F-type H+-transporting ATPase subunit gamma